MKKIILSAFTFLLSLCVANLFAQTCSCRQVLDSLIKKTESNYAGYIHKVKEPGDGPYRKFVKELQAKAGSTSYIDCYNLLESYVAFFKDGHLYIYESAPATAAQADSLRALVKHYEVPADYAQQLLKNTRRDSIEGIWNDALNEQIAIVKISNDLFYGVLQKTKTPKWEPGMVKFELRKTGKNDYNITYTKGDFSTTRFSHERIYKNLLLGFGVYKLVKTTPQNAELQYVNTDNPIHPVVKVIDKNNIVVTVPSALIEEKELDSMLMKYQSVIESTPNLIIDVRGNGGGNFIWGGLYDIANTIVHPVDTKKPGEDDFLLLASEDDARYMDGRLGIYYKKGSPGKKYYDDLVIRIRNNIGRVIGFSYYSSGPDTATRKVYKNPEQVSVIIDKGVASAGEAFVMGIKETSSKVKLYGNNTWGMIDYMNVNTIAFGGKGNPRYYFGYPVYFAKDIKTNPRNPTGIKPDVYIPASNADWVKWVADEYNKRQ